jgi:hypothetical protein
MYCIKKYILAILAAGFLRTTSAASPISWSVTAGYFNVKDGFCHFKDGVISRKVCFPIVKLTNKDMLRGR